LLMSCTPRRDRARVDPPAVVGTDDLVLVRDGAGGAVGIDADAFGAGPDRAVRLLGQHDVGDVMPDRVAISEGERGRPDRLDALQHAAAERGDVVPDRRGEQQVEPVELAVVEQMAVPRQQLGDLRPVVRRERHR